MTEVAALFVDAAGSYADLAGVDLWDEARDARLYPGTAPVVAHPPCQRWGKLWAGQPLWIKRTGQRKIRGDIGASRLDPAVIERMGLARAKRLGEVGSRGGGTDSRPRIGTPEPFRDLLISMARSAMPRPVTPATHLQEER